jgi:hypothetical protein
MAAMAAIKARNAEAGINFPNNKLYAQLIVSEHKPA